MYEKIRSLKGITCMRKYGWPLIISAGLVVLVHYLFNSPLTQDSWLAAQGATPDNPPPLKPMPFIAMYAGWVMYTLFFRSIYMKMGYTSLKQAVTLSASIWAFIAFPVTAIHYIFLKFSWILILIDGVSTLSAFLVAGIFLWALTINTPPAPEAK